MQTVHIFYIKQKEKLSDATFQKHLDSLPKQFREEIKAFKHWESGQASLLGKILLVYGLKKLKYTHALLDIQLSKKDRPYFDADLDFNISHSGDFVVVAISNYGKVGVDVEKHRKLNISLFRKYFDDNEWLEITKADNAVQTFFDLWTIKESTIKCDGRGVEILSKTHKLYNKKNEINCDNQILQFQQFFLDEYYSSTVCSQQAFGLVIKKVELEDF